MFTYILNYFDWYMCDFLYPKNTKELFGKIIKSDSTFDDNPVHNEFNKLNNNEIFIIGNLMMNDKSSHILLKVGDMFINGVEYRSGMKYTVSDNKISFISLSLYLTTLIDNNNYYFEWKIYKNNYTTIRQISDILNKINNSDVSVTNTYLILISDLSVLEASTFVSMTDNPIIKRTGINLTIDPMIKLSVFFGTGNTVHDKTIICIPRTH